jgi:predicted NBD/HSP70 family sugar kinase
MLFRACLTPADGEVVVSVLGLDLTGNDQPALRRANSSVVLRLIARDGPISRRELARRSALTPAAVTQITGDLIAGGLVAEVGPTAERGPRGGRPRTLLDLTADRYHVVAVQIGVGMVHVALTDLRARVLRRGEVARGSEDGASLVDRIVAAAERLLSEADVRRDRVLAVGVAVAGLTNPASGVDLVASRDGWISVALRTALGDRLGGPVVVEEHVRAMALAESWFGAAQAEEQAALIWFGTTIGVGLVAGGEPLVGAHHRAGQLAHVVVERGGPPCACGRRGCLDAVASALAIARRAGAPVGTDMQPMRYVRAAVERGDPTAARAVADAARYVGAAIADLTMLFDPGLVVLAGLAWDLPQVVLPAVEAALAEELAQAPYRPPRLALTRFGAELPLAGAASLALREVYLDPTVFVGRRVGAAA